MSEHANLVSMSVNSGLTENQLHVISVVERTFSVLSLAGSAFIFLTFWGFPYFQKPINRLVVWASIGNVIANLGTLISTSGMIAGPESPLCITQAFLIQFLIPADSFWSLAMAMNVYLTFFKNYDACDLRRLEWIYATLCYGLPFLVAFSYLGVDLTQGKHIYGPAIIWCWVTPRWEWMRIAFFYGPVWVAIFLTMVIYCVTARNIISRLQKLRALSTSEHRLTDMDPEVRSGVAAPRPSLATARSEPITKVVEIQIRSEEIAQFSNTASMDAQSTYGSRQPSPTPESNRQRLEKKQSTAELLDTERTISTRHSNLDVDLESASSPDPMRRFSANIFAASTEYPHQATLSPPHSHSSSQFSASTKGTLKVPVNARGIPQDSSSSRRREGLSSGKAAWSYAKVSLLFFAALLIVWVPSTINRIYSIAHPEGVNFGLSVIAAAVLPMQGIWNAVIYAATSWRQLKTAFKEIYDRARKMGSP